MVGCTVPKYYLLGLYHLYGNDGKLYCIVRLECIGLYHHYLIDVLSYGKSIFSMGSEDEFTSEYVYAIFFKVRSFFSTIQYQDNLDFCMNCIYCT